MSTLKCTLFLAALLSTQICGSHFNFSCILSLCDQFNIKNVDLMDYSYGINSGYQDVSDYIREFSQRGIRIQEIHDARGKLIQNQSRNLHALNSAYLYFNIDPATKIESFLVQDDFGTSPSLFIFSLVAVRGGFTASETLNHALSRIDLKFDNRAFATFQSLPENLFEINRVAKSQPLTVTALETCKTSRASKSSKLKDDKNSSVNPNRNNLKGVKITAVAAPLTDMEDGFDEWTKAYILIWQFMAEHLNFTFVVKQTGRANLPEASWGAMLDAVSKGTVDLSLSPIIMLPSTAEKSDFSVPVHRVSFSVLMRATASERIRWNNFLLPFHSTLWFSILAAVILLTLMLTFFWRAEYERHHNNAPVKLIDLFSESLICIHGAACMQGHPDPPLANSSRTIHFTALVAAVIVMATYSGSFTAFLTVRGDNVPFTSLDELLKSSRYRPYTLDKSPEHSFFEESEHTSLKLFRSKGAPSTAANLTSALQIACGKNATLPPPWSKRVPAFVVPTIWADRFIDLAPCALTDFPMTMQSFWMAFPMTPKFPYKRILDNRMRRVLEGGSIHRFEVDIKKNAKMWREYKEALENRGQNDNVLSMTILDFAPLGVLLAMAVGASLVILSLEFIVYYMW